MTIAVIDTNVLISALLKPTGNPAKVFDHILNGNVLMCYDSNIIAEYKEVLERAKFEFDRKSIEQVLDFIIESGISIIPEPLAIDFDDPDDKIFYEVAVHTGSYLVTGNTKHYPNNPMVLTSKEFLDIFEKRKC